MSGRCGTAADCRLPPQRFFATKRHKRRKNENSNLLRILCCFVAISIFREANESQKTGRQFRQAWAVS